ncbi:MFS transporter [Nesterenkonia natronophila]|uniref:MFS transporter n=1 Tax=Nesterenkonia natronophila TaxID=2174932 RepID=A0A3A4G496_9MICC|nr:MFS transporter [Nesterenkonia natronophila]
MSRWQRWMVLGIVSSALLLIALDNTILYTALPILSNELGATNSQQLWIINGYPLTMAGLLLGSGALGDRFGHKRVFQIGLLIFGSASLAAAFSANPEALIIARLLKGVGAAAMMPATLALIRISFAAERERNVAIAIWAATATVGMAAGPVVSGALLEWFWWGSVFLINVPIVVAASILIIVIGPRNLTNPARRWDAVSSAQALVGMAATVLALKTWAEAPLNLPLAVISSVIGGIVLTLFVRRQLRLMRSPTEPLVDFTVFRNRGFSGGVVAAGASIFTIMGLQLVITQRYQLVEGFTPLEAGMLVTALAVASMPFAIFGGAVLHRVGLLVLIAGGIGTAAIGSGIVIAAALEDSVPMLIAGLVVSGIGLGASMSVASTAIMGNVPPRRAGMAASLEEVSYEFGGLVAVATMGSLLTLVYSRALTLPEGNPDMVGSAPAIALSSDDAAVVSAATAAFDSAYLAVLVATCVVVTLGAFGCAWLLRRYTPGTESQAYPDNH